MSDSVTARRERNRTQSVPQPRLFTIDECYRMAEAGILLPDEHVELLEVTLFTTSPIGGPHMWCIVRLTTWFAGRVAGRALLSVQNAIQLAPRSQPQPDFALVRLPTGDLGDAVPGPEQVLLPIEVSDTTLRHDREVKLPLYAAAGIPEVWIVDLAGQQLRVYQTPRRGSYTRTSVAGRGDTVTPIVFPDLAIPVQDILG